MTERIIDIACGPAMLRSSNKLLQIDSNGQTLRIPFADIEALIVSAPGVCYTQSVLASLLNGGGFFICCDEKHMPVGMLMPLQGHSTQTERFARQFTLTRPACKQLWRQIVRCKLRMQARTLLCLHGNDAGLLKLSNRVLSGDSGNLEAHGARIYWPALFGDPSFRRDPGAEGVNSGLNYGYAVLRGITARAICGAGLHPSLGLHHHNRYDPFCLANDLMEPMRPVVDCIVADMHRKNSNTWEMTPDCKRTLLHRLSARFAVAGEQRSLKDIARRTAQSLAAVVMKTRKELELGEIELEN